MASGAANRWYGVAKGCAPEALDWLQSHTGFVLPVDYSEAVSVHGGAGLPGIVGHYERWGARELPAHRDLGTLLVPVEGESLFEGDSDDCDISSIGCQSLLFDEFVQEDAIASFLLEWRREMLLVFRNSNPQGFCFLDFRFDPVDPPLIVLDTSGLVFRSRGKAPAHWEGIDYIADSFSAALATTEIALGFEYWENYDALPPPSEKARAWWDWRDEALAPFEEIAAFPQNMPRYD